jgi:dihydrofolate synthase/folylpolyglutamate synthase
MTLDGTVFSYGSWRDLQLALLGAYQPYNAANVLEAVELLRNAGLDLPEAAVRSGFRTARWPARFEVLDPTLPLLYDGAHNPEGVSAAVEGIRRYFPEQKVILLTGVMRDKDYAALAAMLEPVVESAYPVTVENPRALPAAEYAVALQEAGIPATPCETPAQALRLARARARETGRPLVCLGSLYLYRALCAALETEPNQ